MERLSEEALASIVELMRGHGLTAKVSSIHVNGWFGGCDKLTTTMALLREAFATDLDAARAAHVFVGDPPNDVPMFACFPHSVGVANIRQFAGRFAHEPRYVTRRASGTGFREVVDCLPDARSNGASASAGLPAR